MSEIRVNVQPFWKNIFKLQKGRLFLDGMQLQKKNKRHRSSNRNAKIYAIILLLRPKKK